MIKYISILLVCLTSFSAHSIVITHGSGGVYTQNNGSNTANSSSFDRAQFLFTPEFADMITVANIGTASIAHSHGSPIDALLEVYDGSSWINVFTYSLPSNGSSVLLSTIFSSPISFSGMTISGLRLDVSAPVRQAYHNVSSAMTYTTSAVPEPSLIAIFSLVLAGLGFSRRSKA